MRPHPWLVVVLAGALLGIVFAGLSTYDFVQHLDRQVHSLHCSFVPGAGKEAGVSGCQVAMMSEYSSVLRSRVWGGIPISLPAMAVFAFLGLFALDLLVTRRKDDPRATAFLALAAGLPAATSLVMLIISLTRLGTTCTLCVSIYVASAACLTGAIGLWRRAVRGRGTGGGDGGAVAAPAAKRRAKEPVPDEPAFTGAGGAGA
ncbi:MAG TPA: vitamin K epoxide reductase family protein, partial [Kofleriaceae bacterium]|nr:vitamin K epoxide reductase family protein [Kofleriaceae bacterium]